GRQDPIPVQPGGTVSNGSFRRDIGADKTAAATPEKFIWAGLCTQNQNPQKKKLLRPQAAKICSVCCGLSRPNRASPTFGKANSIVWMTPNEWPGAWMPLGRVCSIGFGKRGSAGTRARGVGKGILPLALGYRGVAP